MSCPCRSGKEYGVWCLPFHEVKRPDTALKLMQSRYAAYALCLVDYIIYTTHPKNPQFCSNFEEWGKQTIEFSSRTKFKDLKILDFQEKDSSATVLFTAHLFQGKKDVSFKEKSYFEKVKSTWLYRRGWRNP